MCIYINTPEAFVSFWKKQIKRQYIRPSTTYYSLVLDRGKPDYRHNHVIKCARIRTCAH